MRHITPVASFLSPMFIFTPNSALCSPTFFFLNPNPAANHFVQFLFDIFFFFSLDILTISSVLASFLRGLDSSTS
jgi:hypothetical protein